MICLGFSFSRLPAVCVLVGTALCVALFILASEKSSASDEPAAKQPEGKKEDSTAARNSRWVLRFKVASGQDYLDQLKAMKAEILVPIPDTKKSILIKDLSKPNEQRDSSEEDIKRLGKMYKFRDEREKLVKAVAKILNVDQHAPKAFWAYFPNNLEEELLKKELTYRNRRVEDIEETIFRVNVKDGKYEIEVVEQQVKK